MSLSQAEQIPLNSQLRCDECGSIDFANSDIGYVCKNCGIVFRTQKLVYNSPYNKSQLQHEILDPSLTSTQIGTILERQSSEKSSIYRKLNKIQNSKSNEKNLNNCLKGEIKRIFTALELPKSYKEVVFKKCMGIRDHLRPKSKYRNPKKLVPGVTYLCMKLFSISVNQKKILQISDIEKKEFNAFKFVFLDYYPEYKKRDKKEYIMQKVLGISEMFNFGMPFVHTSRNLLDKLWNFINNSKDDIIAGVITTVVMLCNYRSKPPINQICNYLNIKMSSIQNQFKENLFKKLKISGFISLVKSSELLRKKLIKLGWIESKLSSHDRNIKIKVTLGQCPNIYMGNRDIESFTLNLPKISPQKDIIIKKNSSFISSKNNLIFRKVHRLFKLRKLKSDGKDPPSFSFK